MAMICGGASTRYAAVSCFVESRRSMSDVHAVEGRYKGRTKMHKDRLRGSVDPETRTLNKMVDDNGRPALICPRTPMRDLTCKVLVALLLLSWFTRVGGVTVHVPISSEYELSSKWVDTCPMDDTLNYATCTYGDYNWFNFAKCSSKLQQVIDIQVQAEMLNSTVFSIALACIVFFSTVVLLIITCFICKSTHRFHFHKLHEKKFRVIRCDELYGKFDEYIDSILLDGKVGKFLEYVDVFDIAYGGTDPAGNVAWANFEQALKMLMDKDTCCKSFKGKPLIEYCYYVVRCRELIGDFARGGRFDHYDDEHPVQEDIDGNGWLEDPDDRRYADRLPRYTDAEERAAWAILRVWSDMMEDLEVIDDKRPSDLKMRKIDLLVVFEKYQIPMTEFDQCLNEENISCMHRFRDVEVWLPKNLIDDITLFLQRVDPMQITADLVRNHMSKCTQYNYTADEWNLYLSVIPKMAVIRRLEMDNKWGMAQQEMNEMISIAQSREIMLHTSRQFRSALRIMKYCLMKGIWRFKSCFTLLVIIGILIASCLISAASVTTLLTTYKPFEDKGLEFRMVIGQEWGEDPHAPVKHANKPIKRGAGMMRYTNRPIKQESYMCQMVDYGYMDNGCQWFNLKSTNNSRAAFFERVAVSNVTSDYHPNWKLMDECTAELLEEMKGWTNVDLDPLDIDEWKKFVKTRKQYGEDTKEKLVKWIDSLNGTLYQILHDKNARFKNFIKDEVYWKPQRPRGIQAASDTVKVACGVTFDLMARALFSSKYCIKLIPIQDRPQYIEEVLGGGGYIYQTDHTAFESSATKQIQRHIENKIYKTLLPQCSEMYDFLSEWQIINDSSRDGDIFLLPTSRLSGSPNTSLGNTITNIVVLKMIEKQFGVNMKFLVEGDDALINMDREIDEAAVIQFAREQGFDLKLERRGNLNEAGFLSLKWNSGIETWDLSETLIKATQVRLKQAERFGIIPMLKAKLLSAIWLCPSCRSLRDAYEGLNVIDKCLPVCEKDFWFMEQLKSIAAEYVEVDDFVILRNALPPLDERAAKEFDLKYGINASVIDYWQKNLTDGVLAHWQHAMRTMVEWFNPVQEYYDSTVSSLHYYNDKMKKGATVFGNHLKDGSRRMIERVKLYYELMMNTTVDAVNKGVDVSSQQLQSLWDDVNSLKDDAIDKLYRIKDVLKGGEDTKRGFFEFWLTKINMKFNKNWSPWIKWFKEKSKCNDVYSLESKDCVRTFENDEFAALQCLNATMTERDRCYAKANQSYYDMKALGEEREELFEEWRKDEEMNFEDDKFWENMVENMHENDILY